jgi:hypothetical protein
VILNTLGTTLGNERKPDAEKIALAVQQASAGVVHFGKANLVIKHWSMSFTRSAKRSLVRYLRAFYL